MILFQTILARYRSMRFLLASMCSLLFSLSYADTSSDQIEFSRNPNQLIVEFSQTHDLLGPEQAITLKIYGNGSVSTKIPKSRINAGAYSFTLDEDELNTLIGNIVPGVVDAQGNNAIREIAEVQSNYIVSDETHTTISINILQMQLPDGQLITPVNPMIVSETNLGQWRRQTPSLTYRSKLHEIEAQILAIVNESPRRGQ